MTVVGKTKKPAIEAPKPAEVPQTHGLLASIPKEIDVRCTFRLRSIEVVETYTEESSVTAAQTLGEVTARAFGTEKPVRKRWTEKDRAVVARWELDTPDAGGEIVVEGRADLEGITFDDAGKPSDPAKWAAIVKQTVEEAIEEGEERIKDLLVAGVEAEEKAEQT